MSVPGERFRICPDPGARNCVNLHLFVDIIDDFCKHITPLIHLMQVITKNLIYNCNTALKHKMSKPGSIPISPSDKKQQSLFLTKISNISRRIY